MESVIYCLPTIANRFLAINQLGEFLGVKKVKIERHPEESWISDTDSGTPSNQTYFDCAVTKFGMQEVIKVMQEHMPPANEVCYISCLHPFMIAASHKEGESIVVYLLLRQVPSHIIINCYRNNADGNANLKRKRSTT